MRLGLVIAAFVVLTYAGSASTLYVPDNYPTIQGAIDASSKGDVIIVRAGTYAENIDFHGKAVAVRSEEGPQLTVIDGNQAGSVVVFLNEEGLDSVLEGFILTNGSGHEQYGEYYGGGIYCQHASPLILNNIITQNMLPPLDGLGGGICIDEVSQPLIVNNVISDNDAEAGGGIYCGSSYPLIRSNIVHGNMPHCGIEIDESSLTLENNLIFDNSSCGIICYESNLSVKNCTIEGNKTAYGAGIYCAEYSTVLVRDSILWNNHALAPAGFEIIIHDTAHPSTLTIHHSDLEGGVGAVFVDSGCTLNWGSGMIDQDPLFVTGPRGDFYLSHVATLHPVDSPCVDSGSDAAVLLGMETRFTRIDERPDSGQVDMGFHYEGNALQADRYEITPLSSETVTFSLNAGTGNAFRNYILIGSISGTTPGISLPGNQAVLPLNWDLFTSFVINLINTPFFQNFMGTLDGSGKASAVFNPFGALPPELSGYTLYFAFAMDKKWDFASNPVGIKVLAPEVWVDDDYNASTPGWQLTRFDNVQDGIDAAATGGIVHVEAGTYPQTIFIYKTLTLSGANKNTTIIEGNNVGAAVYLSAGGTSLSGFSLINNGTAEGAIVMGIDSDDNTITDNLIVGNRMGMILYFSRNNTITNNAFQQCGVIVYSDQLGDWNTHTINYNTVNGKPIRYYKDGSGVTVPVNTAQAILANCTSFTLQQIDMKDVDTAMQLGFCSNCLIQDNTFTGVMTGVSLVYSNSNDILQNTLSGCRGSGMSLILSQGNDIGQNTIKDGEEEAIEMEGYAMANRIFENTIENTSDCALSLSGFCDQNEIFDNDILNNDCGISIEGCQNNLIYHNNFINSADYHAWVDGGTNFWDKGYPEGGNHWDTWTSPDSNGDGFVDYPYFINVDNVDNYPFVSPL